MALKSAIISAVTPASCLEDKSFPVGHKAEYLSFALEKKLAVELK